MKKCRPSKWVPWSLAGAGLPLLAAAVISTDGLKTDVANRALSAVTAEAPWAKIELSGRDATITGESTSAAAVDAVSKAVADTYGVRTVASAATIVEPVKLVSPTIESITVDTATPEIKGTWPEGVAKTLAVTVAGATYNLPGSPELTSNAGNWTLKLAQPLAVGANEVTAVVSDGASVSQAAEAPATVTVQAPAAPEPAPAPEPVAEAPAAEPAPAPEPAPVDTSSPALPKLAAIAADAKWPFAITGTFDEADTASFKAKFADTEYVLNSGTDFTSDGKGTFTFAPKVDLAPGNYDINFTSQDAAGNSNSFYVDNAVVIPQPVVEAAPADVVAPAAPVLTAIAPDMKWPYAITGTFDEADTKSFSAKFAGGEYVLGTSPDLTSDGKGTFTFAPKVELAPGSYDIDFTAQDAAGNVNVVTAKAAVVIPEPAPVVMEPAAASVVNQLDLTGAPIIKGTWQNSDKHTLSVDVAGKTYVLGKDANIASDVQGNWRLMPSVALADGKYDVAATTAVTGTEVMSKTVGEIVVDATPPAAPTTVAVSANASPTALTGTYDVAQTKTLKVAVPELNVVAELGAAGSALTADAGGNWSLALAKPLTPGTYNVIATAGDEHGRMVEDAAAAEVVITAADVPAPPPPPPYDCAAVMARIDAVFPMRFIYDKTDFAERFGVSVNQYAALLKDPRCATLKVEIAGHADERGPDGYNEDLAERRAATVRDMIVAGGVDTSRLTVASYGESQPLDTTLTEEGWAKNRRVEIKILK